MQLTNRSVWNLKTWIKFIDKLKTTKFLEFNANFVLKKSKLFYYHFTVLKERETTCEWIRERKN